MALTKISTGGVKDDAASQAKIADEAVDEARLQISNAGTNGQFLSKQSGNTGGLTWATATTDTSDKASLSGATFTGDISLGDNDITNVGEISLDKITPDNGANFTVNMGTNKTLQFSGSIGEIGDVTGFQATNDALSANTSFGIRATDIRLATGNAERFRVGSAGQLGVGGATYGTSGQVLTSGGASAAPSWAAIPPAGNTIDLVADGAIAAGKPVIIKSNGKAEQITSTSTTEASTSMWPNSTSVKINEQSSVRFPCIVYDPNNEYAVQIVSQGGADLDYQCLTLNSSGAVTGTAGSNTTISTNSDEMHACWDETNDRVIVAYRDSNDGKGKILTGEFTSASTMSWSNPFTFENSSCGMCNVCHDTTSGKTLICYRLQTGSYIKAKTMTLTISGGSTSASFGSRVDIDNSGLDSNVAYWPRAVRVAGNKFVIGYNDYQSSGTYAYVIVASLSGTSVSCAGKIAVSGSSYKTASIDYGGVMDLMYDTHNEKLIVTYVREDDNMAAWGRVGSVSGTSISWDAAEKRVTISQGTSNQNVVYVRTVYEPYGKTGYMFYIKNTNSGNAYDVFWGGRLAYDSSDANKLDVTNHDHPANAPSNLDQMMGPTALGNRGVILVPVNSDEHTNRNYTWSLISLTSTTVTSNLATANQNFLGFAEDAISDSATGTIKLCGNVVGNQSGLTPGTRYAVNNNGTVSSGGSASSAGGLAVASDKLLIGWVPKS